MLTMMNLISPFLLLALWQHCNLVSATMVESWSKDQQAFVPQKDKSPVTDTVILGAGVIGLATAYQLALAHREATNATCRPPSKILIVERAAHISPAASSQATGGLGDFGFAAGVTDLGALSYDLFQEVASQSGQEDFGFSESTVFRVVPDNFTGIPKPSDNWGPIPPIELPVSALPGWVRPESHWSVQRIAGPPHALHLDPAQFCLFLFKECKKLGVEFIFNAKAVSVAAVPGSKRFSSIQLEHQDHGPLNIPCRSLVIAAGPWSPRVFSTLFPNATLELSMNSTASAGNHFRVRTPGWTPEDDRKGSKQVFFQSNVPGHQGLDITSFLGGELYVGGWGAIPEKLPELAESVHAQPSEIESMKVLAKQYLNIPEDGELDIFAVGRCYRPLGMFKYPIITKVDWDLLGMNGNPEEAPLSSKQEGGDQDCQHGSGGLFLNTAHSGEGVTLSLGSGRIMSELLLGLPPSVDISGLGLS